jgi:primosomal protein N' (replication factor Y)
MYAEILLNHPYARKQETFTYSIPDTFDDFDPSKIEIGSGVIVPFQKKSLPGIVLSLHNKKPTFPTKDIAGLLSTSPLLQDWQINLANWISDYYFCSKFDVFRMFAPKNIFKIQKRKPKENATNATDATNKKLIHSSGKTARADAYILNDDQEKIVNSILKDKPPFSLIHGITGSGKTEIYKQLIKNFVQAGKQCLLLVPEISLTPQLVNYFKSAFPTLAVINSRIGDKKRAEIWHEIQSGEVPLVIGSRSALFSPFKDLGLIIMDEEHEWSYKQDQSPRYHAREIAKKMQELTGAQVVFGSATPSIETMKSALDGTYRLFTMKNRISGVALPKVEVVDMREEIKGGNYSIWSTLLEQKMREKLSRHEQIILFLNRRGSASSTVCRDCGFTLTCRDCELPLTYHSRNFGSPLLICHHCGLVAPILDSCPKCKSVRIKHLGLGTEKVETEAQKLFPTAKIARADKDTMSRTGSFENLHTALQNKEIDVLIGTQMIGKGFDIPGVTLVGVLMADMGLHVPDFRTGEHMFQLLTQVAGRAGRRDQVGEVIIQTYNPDHPSILFSRTHDYDGFYAEEISARAELFFPPFSRMAKLTTVSPDAKTCQKNANTLKDEIKKLNPTCRIFAAPALFGHIGGKYEWNVLIQDEDPNQILKSLPAELLKNFKIDVDPMVSI